MPTVLAIDDDQDVLLYLGKVLEPTGFKTVSAGTAADAYRYLERARPDIVLLDRSLPDGDGLQMLSRLRREYPNLPVVMITADTQPSTVLAARRLGAVDYIRKPLHFDVVRQKAQRAWRIAQMEQAMRVQRKEGRAVLKREGGLRILKLEGPLSEAVLKQISDLLPPGTQLPERFVLDIVEQPELGAEQLQWVRWILSLLAARSARLPAVIAGRNYVLLMDLGLDPETQLFLMLEDVQAHEALQPKHNPLLEVVN